MRMKRIILILIVAVLASAYLQPGSLLLSLATTLGVVTVISVVVSTLAVPPLLANAYTGLRQIDPETRDAAKGMGLSGGQLQRLALARA